jgi:hypothetical protein
MLGCISGDGINVDPNGDGVLMESKIEPETIEGMFGLEGIIPNVERLLNK